MKKIFRLLFKIFTFIPRKTSAGARAFAKKFHMRISVKATIIFSVIFSIVFAGASALTIILYSNYLKQTDEYSVHAVRQLILLTAVVYPIAMALMLAIGHYVMRWILLPIKGMADTAKTITTETLNTRLEGRGSGDEVDALADILNQMLDSLQLSYEKQTRFISDAAHELRTPISVVQGYSNLLKRWGKDDKAVISEAVEAIESESANMKNLVEKLLFLARTDKKALTLEPSEFFMNELVEEIVKEAAVYAESRKISTGQMEAVAVTADRELIKQALRIFLDNSIKYTPISGAATLSCYREGGDYCAIVVSDNGIGISEEDLPHIFERFFKCDKARVRDGGSTGLGLSIAKWILDSHNAEISVSSSLGIGTTFKVLLPEKMDAEE